MNRPPPKTSSNVGTAWQPPSEQQWGGSVVFALCAHALLIAALAWGVRWKQDTQPATVQAELWAALPAPPAPPAPVPPPPAPPPPEVSPLPPTPVAPKPPAVQAKPPSVASAPATKVADIALEKSKKEEQQRKLLEEAKNQKIQKEIEEKKAKELKLRKEKEAQEQRELAERLEKEKRAKTEREKAEREKLEKEKLAKAKAAEQAERDKQEKAEKARLEQQRKLQADKEHTAKAAQQADDKARKEERQRQIQQMMSQAGTHAASDTAGTRTGGANASRGGPSAGYAAKIRGAVLPNIIFTGTVSGNPSASVEVRLLSDGTIASAKIQKSSGVPAWDKAVLDALDRTNRFPKDEDGRVEPIIVIDFRPN